MASNNPFTQNTTYTHEQVDHETFREEADSERLIEDARDSAGIGDYSAAEKSYLSALKNAPREDKAKTAEITTAVKEGLSEIYRSWIQSCRERYDYQEAEPVCQKLQAITDDKRAVKEELIQLYGNWGLSLSLYDRNVIGAILVLAKKLRLEKELGDNTEITESNLRDLLYASNDEKYREKADQLHYSKKETRIRLHLSALIMAGVALVTPLFAPYSIAVYIFSFFMLVIRTDWEHQGPVLYRKKLRKCLGFTFLSLICFILLALSGMNGTAGKFGSAYTVISMITFFILISLSTCVMLDALGQFRIYFSSHRCNVLDVMKDVPAPVRVSCKSCRTKLKISGETTSAVKCPKCGATVREALDLGIKNKPSHSPKQRESGDYDPKAAWRRVGGIGIGLVVREIFRNIRF